MLSPPEQHQSFMTSLQSDFTSALYSRFIILFFSAKIDWIHLYIFTEFVAKSDPPRNCYTGTQIRQTVCQIYQYADERHHFPFG
jgi:hypothetical protein